MKRLVLPAMIGGALFLGPLLIVLLAVLLFSAAGAASLLLLASSVLHRVRGA